METPARSAAQAPAAYYLAGAGGRPGAFYVNTSSLAERRTYECDSLALHEAIPGHHTQAAVSTENDEIEDFRSFCEDRRYASKWGGGAAHQRRRCDRSREETGRARQYPPSLALAPPRPRSPPPPLTPPCRYFEAPSRFPFYTGYIEGWGLHCEGLGDELGLYKTNADRFGRLSMEQLRACRLVVDTGLHALGWSWQRAYEFMLEKSGCTEVDARQETTRYVTWPGQACAYKVGELKLNELRRMWEVEGKGELDIRDFCTSTP